MTDPMSAIPTWEDCHAAGMTAHQAAVARGSCKTSAYGWSARAGVKWADGRYTIAAARPARKLAPLWQDCWNRGLTARQAMAEIGTLSLEQAKRWASSMGVSWPPDPLMKYGYPNVVDLPRLPPITDPAELDPVACREMWAAMVAHHLNDLACGMLAIKQGSKPRAVTERERAETKRWVRSKDFSICATLAGIDPEATRDRLHARGLL